MRSMWEEKDNGIDIKKNWAHHGREIYENDVRLNRCIAWKTVGRYKELP